MDEIHRQYQKTTRFRNFMKINNIDLALINFDFKLVRTRRD